MQKMYFLSKSNQLLLCAVCVFRSRYSTPTQDRCCAHVQGHGKSDATMPGPSGMLPLETLLSTNFHHNFSTVLLTCVETDPPVPESQIPSVCIAAAAASKIDHVNKNDQRAVPEAE